MGNRLFPIWPYKAGEAASGIFNRVVCVVILLHKSDACKIKPLSGGIFFELSIGLDICSAPRGVLGADAVFIGMVRLISVRRRENIVLSLSVW